MWTRYRIVTVLWVCQAHSFTNPKNCRCFLTSHRPYSADVHFIDLLFGIHLKAVLKLHFPMLTRSKCCRLDVFLIPVRDLFLPWDLAGWEAFAHRASRCGFLTDSRRCSLWQDVPLTQRLTWQNRRSDWAAGWSGTAYFCGIQEAQRQRNYFKCSQYLRASRALVGAQ